MSMRQLKIIFCAMGLMAVLAAAFHMAQRANHNIQKHPQLITGTRLPQPMTLPAFHLMSGGQPMTPEALKGQWHVLFFGFTHCPGMCPTTLARMNQVMKILSEKNATLPTLWFISIDTKNDTPAMTQRYAQTFNRHFVGLSGTQAQVDALAKTLNVAYGRVITTTENGHSQSTLNHSGHITVVNPQGQVVAFLTRPDEPANVAQDLMTLMQNVS